MTDMQYIKKFTFHLSFLRKLLEKVIRSEVGESKQTNKQKNSWDLTQDRGKKNPSKTVMQQTSESDRPKVEDKTSSIPFSNN